ncbi:hypothetical protein ACFV9C_32265 [Kribbella sp. NPDC059898]|uniref:hypothetical protein n=1 Tax=Kribbella sp. NPDC059898 TaxID=3346995 RepID=UPI0036488508
MSTFGLMSLTGDPGGEPVPVRAAAVCGRGADHHGREQRTEVTLESLHLPGNATRGFMDFMLMMGVAGAGAKADHVDSLDLFHTMEACFTWYPNGVPA